MTLNPIPYEFPLYEENLLFFFNNAFTLRSYLIVQIFDEKTMIRCKDIVMRAQLQFLTFLTP